MTDAERKDRYLMLTLGPKDAKRLKKHAKKSQLSPIELVRIVLNQHLNRVTGVTMPLEPIGKYHAKHERGQRFTLRVLAEEPGLTISRLAQRLGTYQPFMTKMAETLAEKKLIRSKTATNGDIRHWYLTPQGKRELTRASRPGRSR